MALDAVIRDILAKAKSEAESLISSAEKESDSILKESEASIAQKRRVQEKQLEELTRRLVRQEVSSAELEAKKIVLNAKKEILDRTFSEVLDELFKMDRGNRARIYANILQKTRGVIADPKVYCPKGDASLLEGTVPRERVTEVDMEPGLIVESADGMLRLDFRFRTLLEDIWEREMKSVSAILFG